MRITSPGPLRYLRPLALALLAATPGCTSDDRPPRDIVGAADASAGADRPRQGGAGGNMTGAGGVGGAGGAAGMGVDSGSDPGTSLDARNDTGTTSVSDGSAGSGGMNPLPPPGGGPATFDDLEVGDRAQDRLEEFSFVLGKDTTTVRCWMPGGIKVIRGLAINASSSNHAKEFARLVNFGLMSLGGSQADWGNRLPMAVKECATRHNRPELNNAAFVGSGHSASTGPNTRTVTFFPERFVISAPGGLEYAPPDGAAMKVPILLWYGSRDGSQSLVHVRNLETVRPKGALYGIVPEWGGGHVYGYSSNLSHVAFAQGIARRYPSSQDPSKGAVKLTEVKENEGWFGERNGWLPEANGSGNWKFIEKGTLPGIAPYATYKGDKSKSIWLLDSYIAHVWRAYSTPDDTVKMIFPNPQHSESKAPITFIEPGGVFTAQASVSSPAASVQKVALYDGDKVLAETTSAPYQFPGIKLHPGIHALIAVATYTDGKVVVSRPATVYALRLPCPAADGFPVNCVKKP